MVFLRKIEVFFMYLQNMDDFIEIPKEVYGIIKVALYSEKKEDRIRNEENQVKKIKKANEYLVTIKKKWKN